MEPKTYIQQCHSGKTRIYKGKLPPAENGPYWEMTEEEPMMQALEPVEKKDTSLVWWISAVVVGWAAVGGLVYWAIQ